MHSASETIQKGRIFETQITPPSKIVHACIPTQDTTFSTNYKFCIVTRLRNKGNLIEMVKYVVLDILRKDIISK